MNSPSPLIPQGSNPEQQNQSRSSLKVKIFCAIGVNVAVLLGLLLQGCKREQPAAPMDTVPVYSDMNQPPDLTDTNMQAGAVDAPYEAIQPDAQPYMAPVPQPTASATEYKIEKGDSFYTIGKKYGVTVKAIQAANPTVDPTRLQIGKTIQIPAPTSAPAELSASPAVGAASGQTIHIVKSGDTLGRLAVQYRTSVAAIQSANGLKDTRIKVGDKLKIPAKTSAP